MKKYETDHEKLCRLDMKGRMKNDSRTWFDFFLQKFDEQPFLVKLGGKEYKVGEGEPTFTVKFNKSIPVSDLLTSTSIALGEAYMNGDLEIEGDLYEALDHFLGQMGKFSTDQKALKKLIFTSSGKKNQEKEVRSHYI